MQWSKLVSYWLSSLCDLLSWTFCYSFKASTKTPKRITKPLEKSLHVTGFSNFLRLSRFLRFLEVLEVSQGSKNPHGLHKIDKSTNSTIVLTLLGATTQLLFLRKMGGAAGAVQYISSLAQIGTDKRESWSNVFGIDHVPKNQWCEFHKSITP